MSEEIKKAVKAKAKSETKGLEAIEMTAEQKEKFLKFMEEEELKAIAKKDAEDIKGEKTKVNLNFKHNISGKSYGPGRHIEIPVLLLGQLQQQENDLRNAEMKMLTGNKRLFEVMQGGGGSIEVGGQRTPAWFK